MNATAALQDRAPCADSVDLLALHRANPARYPFLLESVAGNRSHTARYSLLLACPDESITLTTAGLFENHKASTTDDFLDCLNSHYRNNRSGAAEDPALPFTGGWFLYLGYELAAQIEPCLCLPHKASHLPIALAVRCRAAVIVDHLSGATRTMVEADHPEQAALYAQLQRDIDECKPAETELPPPALRQWHEDEEQVFLDNVGRIKDYIRAGDVFQVNLSRQWRIECTQAIDPADLYTRLRLANPAPFSGLFQWQGSSVISSSPERLIAVNHRHVQTRPIAGTRPRQQTQADDRAMRRELLLHPKERAEHIMLIDLERNDLGRVCEAGSIVVDELLGLESYAHVHHIVSNVSGRLRSDRSPVDAIRAVFPGGTITGCPKVHCMEIIAELEQGGRGAYTGAMGYLSRNGNLDLNILIRSLEQTNSQIQFRAGAGIVADSDPAAELIETRAKARGLLRALGLNG